MLPECDITHHLRGFIRAGVSNSLNHSFVCLRRSNPEARRVKYPQREAVFLRQSFLDQRVCRIPDPAAAQFEQTRHAGTVEIRHQLLETGYGFVVRNFRQYTPPEPENGPASMNDARGSAGLASGYPPPSRRFEILIDSRLIEGQAVQNHESIGLLNEYGVVRGGQVQLLFRKQTRRIPELSRAPSTNDEHPFAAFHGFRFGGNEG